MFNLTRSLDRNADRTPHEDAVIFRDSRLTHLELFDRVNALAAALTEAGIGEGDIVALLLGNRPEFLESALAVNRVGAAFLPLNVRLAEPEIEYIIGHAGAAAIVTEPGFAGPVAAVGSRLAPPWTVADCRQGGGRRPAGHRLRVVPRRASRRTRPRLPRSRESDLHRLMYSSGTTAHPKGVPITYGNFYWKTIGHVAEFGISAADRTLMAGPMYHVGAFDLPGIGTWWAGGSLVILPRFDVPDLLATIARDRPTNVWLAPAMVNAILNAIAQSPELGELQHRERALHHRRR